MINKETKEWAPVPRFLNAVQLTKDVTEITDAARGKTFSNFMMALALLKNYSPFEGPPRSDALDLFKKFDKTWALTKGSDKKYGRTSPERTYEDAMKRRQTDPWNFLFIAGMWFQDLFNYDFRRTEMCIIPYATQQGEISFCAYNTGVGWRKIIENMHKNATVAQWYKEHGKHEIYAKGKNVNLDTFEHSLRIDADDAARVRHLEHDIPLTAAEEDRARRRKKALRGTSQGSRHLRRARPEEASADGRADRHRQRYRQGRARQLRQRGKARHHRPSSRKWQRPLCPSQAGNHRRSRGRRLNQQFNFAFQPAPEKSGAFFLPRTLRPASNQLSSRPEQTDAFSPTSLGEVVGLRSGGISLRFIA